MREAEIDDRKDLMCPVERIEYEAGNRLGKLYLPESCSANAEGIIRLFRDIDKQVKRVLVFSGAELEFIYRIEELDWEVFVPK
jgi:hypothetical protein